MAFKLVVMVACAVFASANAGLTVTSGSDNTYRSPGNLAQISTHTKTIETPFSSSSKSDVRVSNPGVYVSAQPALSYSAQASPVYATTGPAYYSNQPAKLAYAAGPVSYSAPAQVSYSAPAPVSYSAPAPAYAYAAAPAAHVSYYPQQQTAYAAQSVHPIGQQIYATAAAAPAAYQVAQPAAQLAYSAPAVYSHAAPAYNYAAHAAAPIPAAHQPLVKVTYSPAAEVSHLTYSNVNDHINYGW